MQIEIYEEFEKWLDDLFENNDIPQRTTAYCFNLYDEENALYAVQIIGADSFDENDSDWACNETWSSEEDIFGIDLSDEQKKDREQAYEYIAEFVEKYLESGKYKDILLNSDGIGIGFVDGELYIIGQE